MRLQGLITENDLIEIDNGHWDDIGALWRVRSPNSWNPLRGPLYSGPYFVGLHSGPSMISVSVLYGL